MERLKCMLNDVQITRCLSKLRRFCNMLDPMIFEKVCSLPFEKFETPEQYHSIPDVAYTPISTGDVWGGEGTYCWFKSSYTVPESLAGRPLFLRPSVGGYEAMLWVDGKPMGTYATKIVVTGHGNHYCDMIAQHPSAGQTLELAIEFYAGHYVMGEQPFETRPRSDFRFTYQTIDLCVRNELVTKFLFDLQTLLSLYDALEDSSYRRAEIENVLVRLHEIVYYSPDDIDRATFDAALEEGLAVMAPSLARTNGNATVPYVGLIGHSHMDTAWLWHIDETIKKCARTSSNQMNLMEQYPEYKFVQSSSYHSDMIRRHYPELFERIREKVAEGRYEPNGGVWVECDCNITSGESMIRQFLWGQRFTREHFGYTSDAFWLPDTFGYSAAIPQIMQGCDVHYFLTTKIAWNDTNPFPYDSFYWKGIDGTTVFAHFNKTHIGTLPHEVMPLLHNKKGNDSVRQKNVSQSKLISFGFGDGGGGPQWDQIEHSLRCKDLEGCPKYEYTTVSDFMKRLEAEVQDPATYAGELYLELHRGTLTNQHEIKRNNRLSEIALHNLEVLTVARAVAAQEIASDEAFREMQNTLLVNQFHDILPGTCIPRANHQAKDEMTALLAQAHQLTDSLLDRDDTAKHLTVYNPSSYERNDVLYLDGSVSGVSGYRTQRVSTVRGEEKLAVGGLTIAPYASVQLDECGASESASSFAYDGKTLETPFATVTFTEDGTISSFYDRTAARELCGEGYPLNTFLLAEDVPAGWDNWDIDADVELKFRPSAQLLSESVVSDGSVEFRIRRSYRLTAKSTLTQDMIFYADSPEVRFETLMDWNDDHRLLKTAFDTDVFSDFVRQEIQFGYLKRPTTRNNSVEQAKFEVLNHKYTDLSEQNYGVAILNDCKYGISAFGGQLRLTLHRGGVRPDFTGDHGQHYCEYSFLPHASGFSAESVVRPAYLLNVKHLVVRGGTAVASFAQTDDSNVVIETIKPCEDRERALILRLYESEGGRTNTMLHLGFEPTGVWETNMLEETQRTLDTSSSIPLTLRPFEIKTIKIAY